MRFNRLDLNLLVTLDALLDERRITRAAERLNLSQSAISGMLAKLREYFDDELLVPVGRNLELTPRARELVQPVRDLLLQVQTIVAIDPEFEPANARRHFKIATSDYVINVLMHRLIPVIEPLAPHITIEFMPQVEDSAEKLRRGEYDFLIIPEPFIAPDHPHRPLFDDRYTCVVWEGNTKVGARLESVEQFERLDHVAALLGWPRAPTYDSRYLEAQGIERCVRVTTSDFCSIATALIGTQMIAIMHRRLANELSRRLPLRLVHTPIEIPTVREFLQWHEYREKDPCHRWLRERLIEAAAGLAA
ncbi:LysR substrate-binding domain-containing protein [Paraburkholderia tropica]|uniref:LysR family transcriptional regulator n=1 Tax=Paraburkholderia tropica TaxID=92647 RepID=A0ABX5MB74_9BURK|nr:LysR substrate-binding domain-containing protein [Paraburkholderia tropica]MBB2984454.1 DNA-binding transcriptional LysR family regulator [Paraburkholderia tropica]PXX03461.1 LysR family transcriptional regulator [Paraburkholderia tropica]PZW69380.1 LysR family transcriptional regulator [Paraburkholderia tropica]